MSESKTLSKTGHTGRRIARTEAFADDPTHREGGDTELAMSQPLSIEQADPACGGSYSAARSIAARTFGGDIGRL